MNDQWDSEPVFCFSADIDWASEAVVEYSHDALSGKELKLTYFNTHPSPYLNQLEASKEVRMLVHPNFLPNSSHGDSFEEVIAYCKKLVPHADGFRSHRYFEVNDIMDTLAKQGFKFVSNHCTRCETNLRPLIHRSGMVSLPIFLEDGGYLIMDPDLNFQNLEARLASPGLKIINFHPAHIAFNTPEFKYTRAIKDGMSREEWNNIDADVLNKLEYKGNGVRTTIQKIHEYAVRHNHRIIGMHELYNEYRKGQSLVSGDQYSLDQAG